MTPRSAAPLVALYLSLAGCTANLFDPGGGSGPKPGEPGYMGPGSGLGPDGGPGSGPGGPGSGPGGPGAASGPADPQAAGPMPLRRLTRREFNNTVRDLLGVTSNPADAFPLDIDGTFMFHRAGVVSTLDASVMFDTAAEVVKGIDVTKLYTCNPSEEDACATSFIQTFGARAFRRPVSAEESSRLLALFKAGRSAEQGLDFNESIRLVLEGMLQSPGFLYHWELGPNAPTLEGAVAKLNGYEVASRLSYFLWRSMPDQALFDAAKQNMLGTPEAVATQVDRMLGDERAKPTIESFFDEWLGLEELPERPKDMQIYPEFNEQLALAMQDENRAFIDSVLFGGDGTFTSLLTGTSSNVPGPLAAIYGTSAGASALSGSERSGLLTRAGFLTLTGSTTGSNPVKRGRRVYEGLLCGILPPPPNNVPPTKPASAGGTTRQRFEEHDQNPCAQGCHTLMDPIGFAFEHYDGIGRYRTQDNNLPVDSKTTVSLDGTDHPIADAVELSSVLAQSPTAQNCFATVWARFALLRDTTEADRYSLETTQGAFSKAGLKVSDLLASVATSRTFLYRSIAEGEVTQ